MSNALPNSLLSLSTVRRFMSSDQPKKENPEGPDIWKSPKQPK
jgi:hypothetical protein